MTKNQNKIWNRDTPRLLGAPQMSSNVQGLILSYGQKKQNDFGLIWDFTQKKKY